MSAEKKSNSPEFKSKKMALNDLISTSEVLKIISKIEKKVPQQSHTHISISEFLKKVEEQIKGKAYFRENILPQIDMNEAYQGEGSEECFKRYKQELIWGLQQYFANSKNASKSLEDIFEIPASEKISADEVKALTKKYPEIELMRKASLVYGDFPFENPRLKNIQKEDIKKIYLFIEEFVHGGNLVWIKQK